ncbi:MAG: hypothetical protein J6K26_01985, partial [Lachnospiraceae bacterium]|nr:hypothetical protein [Lachnospiraceae bacterium]
MRLKRSRLKWYSHRKAVPYKDNEGSSGIEYGPPSSFMAEVWPAGGKVQAEMYGQRLTHIYNCRIQGKYQTHIENGIVHYDFDTFSIAETDGICLFVPPESDPDYRVISI